MENRSNRDKRANKMTIDEGIDKKIQMSRSALIVSCLGSHRAKQIKKKLCAQFNYDFCFRNSTCGKRDQISLP